MSTDSTGLAPGSGRFDLATCERVASLLAHGVSEADVCATLFLGSDDLAEVRNTESFQVAYADDKRQLQDRQLSIAENWDNIEIKSQQGILQMLEMPMQRNPSILLAAARIANGAKRPRADGNRIDVPTNTVVALVLPTVLRKKISSGELPVVGSQSTKDEHARLEGLQLKQTDLLSPMAVHELLDPDTAGGTPVAKSEAEMDSALSLMFGGESVEEDGGETK